MNYMMNMMSMMNMMNMMMIVKRKVKELEKIDYYKEEEIILHLLNIIIKMIMKILIIKFVIGLFYYIYQS